MISRLTSFYATQLRVLWEWKGGRVALLKRLVITLVVATISFLATAWLLPRMAIDAPVVVNAAIAVILIALFNAAVRPVVLALAAPVSLILVGVLVLVLQVLSFIVIAQWAPGVHVDAFGTALIGSFVYAIINTILTSILGHRQRRLLLRGARPDAAGQALGRADRQAGPGDHPDRRPGPSDPGRPDARRLGQHDGRSRPRWHATSCRAGRRSCRR